LSLTPWLWLYWPVSSVARDGQHNGNVTNAFENVVPWSARRRCTWGITRIDSSVWSSVRITTMFGGSFPCATSNRYSAMATCALVTRPPGRNVPSDRALTTPRATNQSNAP